MRKFFLGAFLLFSFIAIWGWAKKPPKPKSVVKVEEIALGTSRAPMPVVQEVKEEEPEMDRVQQLFDLDEDALPIVETVSFTSRVPWLKGRPAWVADYASYYQTSRHFIARSLNRSTDYLTQKVHVGDRFNVFKKDKDIKFHLVVDLSKCKMAFYYLDKNEKVLLKTYKVGVGKAAGGTSGCSTPLGKFELGSKTAIYKPGVMGLFQEAKTEMVRIFGTRWLPLNHTNGLGLQGLPWVEESGKLVEDRSKLGKHDSDGCIRLAQEDIEELYAIVITKPTTVEIIR